MNLLLFHLDSRIDALTNHRIHLYIVWYVIACFFCLLGISSFADSHDAKFLSDYPNRLTRDGDVVILPDHGTVYMATDFHAHWGDFNQWLMRTQLVEQIEAGEDVYGLILGDAVDHKPGDPIFEPFGDVKIVDRMAQIQKQLGARGERLIYLRGNHELAAAETYGELKNQGMNEANRHRRIDRLYRSPQGAYFQQFNFIERMTDAHHDYLAHLPTVAIGKNGCVGIHAGTSRFAKNLSALVRPTPKVLEELLWSRPAVAQVGGYTSSQTTAFLDRIGGSVLIVGHTPLSYLPKKSVQNGVALLGMRQLFFTTGYGAAPGIPVYLVIDLAKRYASVSEFQYGVEIQPLYP